MPPEDDDDQLDPEDREDSDVEGLGDKGKAALERERQARKDAKREAREAQKRANELATALKAERFARLKSQHSWLEESDLDGIDLDAWESKIERLATIAGVAGQPPSNTASEQASAETRAEVQRFTQAAGGTSGQGDTSKTYTPEEVRQIGLKNQAEALAIIQSGRMQKP